MTGWFLGYMALSCSTEQGIVGLWDAVEKDGMQFPIVYEGEVAQDELGDPDLQKSVQEMQIDIQEEGVGTLVSHFEMTNVDGSTYEFSYPMAMTIDLENNPYVLIARDSETGEEITMECMHTQANLLGCSYTVNDPEIPQGTLTFAPSPI